MSYFAKKKKRERRNTKGNLQMNVFGQLEFVINAYEMNQWVCDVTKRNANVEVFKNTGDLKHSPWYSLT